MIECFRRLAEFTSFISNRHLSHFCSIGPNGILAFRSNGDVSERPVANCRSIGPDGIFASIIFYLLLAYPPCQYRDRNRGESQKHHDADDTRESLQRSRVSSRAPAKRLQHAPDSVTEVQAQCAHSHDVEDRDWPDVERHHHVLINGEVFELSRLEADNTSSQMQKMKNDKYS